MEIKELGHVVLGVRDLQRSTRFYRDVLGLRCVAPLRENGLFFTGADGRSHHELLLLQVNPADAGAPSPETQGRLGLRHVAFKIGSSDAELEQALAELRQAEAPITDIVNHGDVTHSIYLKDPDGNTVEVYVDIDQAWRQDPAHASVMATGTRPLEMKS
jgi:catechol-2,3-dioxygenase